MAVAAGRAGRPDVLAALGRNERTGEEKYFVAGGAEAAKLCQRLRVGFTRWNVEHTLRVSKSELGFRHFEGATTWG